jgi:hypothetical protein
MRGGVHRAWLVPVLFLGIAAAMARPGAAQGVPLAIEDMPLAQERAVKRGEDGYTGLRRLVSAA